jgi:hypothetical protein
MTCKQTEILQEAVSDLMQLQSVIELASFAAETRRVLTEVHGLAQINPAFGKKMHSISGWCTFMEMPDSLGDVLLQAANAIQKSHELIDRASMEGGKA